MTKQNKYVPKPSRCAVSSYFDGMIGKVFKILPMREEGCASLGIYVDSLLAELIGCGGVVDGLLDDGTYLSLLSVIQYLNDKMPEVDIVRREVFKAISICERLKASFIDRAEGGAVR